MLCEDFVGGRTVDADSEDLSTRLLKFGDISLIRLKFGRSTPGEGEDIECQHYVLLPKKLAQGYLLTVLIRQGEIRRLIAYIEHCDRSSQRPAY